MSSQEEIKRNKERVAKEMSSSIAKMAEEMGFSRSAIHKTIERFVMLLFLMDCKFN